MGVGLIQADANALRRDLAARLPELERPVVLQGTLAELRELLSLRAEADIRFDAVIGRNVLASMNRATGCRG